MTQDEIIAAMQSGLRLHQAGDLDGAEAAYRRALEGQPDLADALNLLGVVSLQKGRSDAAVELIGKAIAAAPATADYHNNLGNAFDALGRTPEALASYQKANELEPARGDVLANLAQALLESGRVNEAVTAGEAAIQAAPDFEGAYDGLGTALTAAGRLDDAAVYLNAALQLKPDFHEAHLHLGQLLRAQHRPEEAATSFRQAIALKPAEVEAQHALAELLAEQGRQDEAAELLLTAAQQHPTQADTQKRAGVALAQVRRWAEAEACQRRAVEIAPEDHEAWSHLGKVFDIQGHYEAAVTCHERAVALRADAPTMFYLGGTLAKMGRLDEAASQFKAALQLDPNRSVVLGSLGGVEIAQGQVEEGLANLRRALILDPGALSVHSKLLLASHFDPAQDPTALFDAHRQWAQQHAAALSASITPHLNDRDPERRLRIGYLSPDFKNHPVALFMEPVLAGHGQDVQVICYADVERPDDMTPRLQRFGTWRNICGQPHEQIARQIRDDRIDVLVDLAGHTSAGQMLLLARKPAPVQVTYLGYPNTTGLATVDYRITDSYADPPGMTEQFYTERLYRLDPCAWIYRAPEEAPGVGPLPAAAAGHVTFGSFNALPKVNREIARLWSRVLQAVPNARLVLKNRGLRDRAAQDAVRKLFEGLGVSPDRLELLGGTPLTRDHLATYNRIDVGLDAFPYHGTTTTCEALWMGVPVVTLAGRTHVSRVGVSLLSNAGLAEMIAQTPDQFVEIAVRLATDAPRLAALRAGQRERLIDSPLLDREQFGRRLESAYRVMWRRWCAGPA